MSVGAWVGGLVASIVGGWWPIGIRQGSSASPAGCGIQGGGDRGQRWTARKEGKEDASTVERPGQKISNEVQEIDKLQQVQAPNAHLLWTEDAQKI